MRSSGLTIMGTCPSFRYGQTSHAFLESVRTATARAESHGWSSLLIYSDHRQIDPWILAQILLSTTSKLTPLIALQPLYMHPFAAAKSIASLSLLYDRPININFVSGGLPRDLETFCDSLPHDERYDRIVEYGAIMRHILFEKTPLTFLGRYYRVRSLQLQPWPALKSHCVPTLTISGSSPAGLAAARQLGARAIQYLRPPNDYDGVVFSPELQYGARVGIVSRPKTSDAWEVARERYPADASGAEIRKYFTKISDSAWVRELGRSGNSPQESPYWLGPYNNNQASCPFLVGDISEVAAALSGYIRMGLRTFLVENPPTDEDAIYINETFKVAEALAKSEAEMARPG